MEITNFAIIIGAIKCGTTSFFNYLSQHPDICACSKKEAKFFNNQFHKGFDYYRSLWQWDPATHKVALEATPGYTRYTQRNPRNAAENIRAVMDLDPSLSFKFIYIVRDPIERIESHYNHAQQMFSNTKIQSADGGIDDELIEITQYATQIEEYYQRFPAASVLLLNFEDVKQNPRDTLRRVCEFLEVDPEFDFQKVGVVYNSQAQRRELVFPGLKWMEKRGWKRKVSSWLSEENKQQVRQLIGRQRQKVHFSQGQRQAAMAQLTADLSRLQSTHGIDISRWKNVDV